MALVGDQILELDGQNSLLPLFQNPQDSPAFFENLITVGKSNVLRDHNSHWQAGTDCTSPPTRNTLGGMTAPVRQEYSSLAGRYSLYLPAKEEPPLAGTLYAGPPRKSQPWSAGTMCCPAEVDN
ncbi:hypothetical protein PCASD_05090 [Puccinia coronata f. sp. avenae]|uniref:Uncharacterized protein n=1 Tax=Puccinia coronata f. sp. avenae TaxID=200324 RepID=A0A2N5VGC4_9BASI|nr:hypothetical protein PCASD_18599 [Puccinia coronata f. sp. avenae]PLW49037.1 hypothetical protein PCASD_05090 [Puccinia coronata f. sp. avenae]